MASSRRPSTGDSGSSNSSRSGSRIRHDVLWKLTDPCPDDPTSVVCRVCGDFITCSDANTVTNYRSLNGNAILGRTFQNVQERQHCLTTLLCLFLARNHLSFLCLNDPVFRLYCSIVGHELPTTRSNINSWLCGTMGYKVDFLIKTLAGDAAAAAITFDHWCASLTRNIRYLSISAHLYRPNEESDDTKISTHLLAVLKVHTEKETETADRIKETLEKFNLQYKCYSCICDGAAVPVGTHFPSMVTASCAAHLLQLAIKAMFWSKGTIWGDTVEYVRSLCRESCFSEGRQATEGVSIGGDVVTRWGATYKMLRKALNEWDALGKLIHDAKPEDDYSHLTLADLKVLARQHSLQEKGKKAEIIERLIESRVPPPPQGGFANPSSAGKKQPKNPPKKRKKAPGDDGTKRTSKKIVDATTSVQHKRAKPVVEALVELLRPCEVAKDVFGHRNARLSCVLPMLSAIFTDLEKFMDPTKSDPMRQDRFPSLWSDATESDESDDSDGDDVLEPAILLDRGARWLSMWIERFFLYRRYDGGAFIYERDCMGLGGMDNPHHPLFLYWVKNTYPVIDAMTATITDERFAKSIDHPMHRRVFRALRFHLNIGDNEPQPWHAVIVAIMKKCFPDQNQVPLERSLLEPDPMWVIQLQIYKVVIMRLNQEKKYKLQDNPSLNTLIERLSRIYKREMPCDAVTTLTAYIQEYLPCPVSDHPVLHKLSLTFIACPAASTNQEREFSLMNKDDFNEDRSRSSSETVQTIRKVSDCSVDILRLLLPVKPTREGSSRWMVTDEAQAEGTKNLELINLFAKYDPTAAWWCTGGVGLPTADSCLGSPRPSEFSPDPMS